MSTPQDPQKRAAATYNAASDCYDHPVNFFWEHYGRRTVERLALPLGAHVLDVCCGSGASAIPAAETVGPAGFVLGIDLAEKLLELARLKAKKHGLENLDFRTGDMLDLGFPESSFDAVICVFGIFFVPDMQAAVSKLWGLVRPNGKLAITTWGPRFFEPVNTAFWDSIRAIRADLYKGFNPWDRISEPDAVRSLFATLRVEQLDVLAEPGTCTLSSPEDWWQMVLGTGYRGTIDQLDAEAREDVRRNNLDFISRCDVRSVEANVVYAVAVKKETESCDQVQSF